MALEPQGTQNLPLDPSQEPQLNVPPISLANQGGPQTARPTPPAQPAVSAQPRTPQTPPVRTMQGDINSLEGRLAVSNNPSFEADEPVFTPETTNQLDAPVDELIAAHQRRSRILWIIGAIVVIIVFIVIGFFVLQPKTDTPPVADTGDTEPTDTGTTTEILSHASRFTTAPASTIAATLSKAPTRDEILGVLVKEGQRAGLGLTEVTFTDADASQIPVAVFLSALAPSFLEANKSGTLFTADFTAFIYKDAAGTWPGYVLTQKQGTDAAAINQWLASLEASKLSEFFIVDPGAFKGFKNGTINTIPDRYNPGTTSNASFGHLTRTGTLLIATSFSGMKEAVKLLGL